MLSCIFCKIIKGEIPGKFIHKDKNFVVFYDINPKAPLHVLIVPVKHIKSLTEVADSDKLLVGEMMLLIRNMAKRLDIAETGYKIVINNGLGSGQLVFHLHAHMLAGWRKSAHWQV